MPADFPAANIKNTALNCNGTLAVDVQLSCQSSTFVYKLFFVNSIEGEMAPSVNQFKSVFHAHGKGHVVSLKSFKCRFEIAF